MQKLVDDWKYMRAHADAPLSTFLDYCTYGHMIDNVVRLVVGTLHERETSEIIAKCHPLGTPCTVDTTPPWWFLQIVPLGRWWWWWWWL